jgi:hypothetical protein
MRLADIADVFSGRPISRLRGDEVLFPRRVLALRDVTTRVARIDSLEEVEAPLGSETERLSLRSGDIVVTSRGRVRAAVSEAEHEGVLVGPNLVVVRLNHSGLPPELLAAYLRHPEVERELLAQMPGTGTPGFTVEGLKSLEVQMPVAPAAQDLSELVSHVENYYSHLIKGAMLTRSAVLEVVYDTLNPNDA